MVKTRHSGDVDLETPPRFISLNNEKNRQSTRNSDAIENKLSHVYGNQNDLYNIFDDKVVESRLRPRIGPSRTYNYIDVDSSDEDSLQRQSHLVFTRSRQIKQEMLSKHVLRGSIRSSSSFREEDADQFVDDDDDNNIIQKRTSSVRHKESTDSKENLKDGNVIVQKKKYPSKHHPDEEDISRGKISNRLSRGSEDDDDETGNFIRRSSRTRRQVYDTLNQSFLVSIPGQKKQTTEDNDHSDTKDDSEDNQEFSDMYSRVKRKRVRVKRNMYGIPVTEDSDSSPDIRKQNKNNSKDDEFESESQEDDAEDGMDGIEKDDFNNTSRRVTRKQNLPVKKIQPTIVKSYSLREHKPRTDLYKAPLEERKVKKMHSSIFIGTPVKKNVSQTYHSPAQRRNIRKRSAFHSSSSSTSSSSDGESSDEKSFKRRKTKSMAKARSRLMPMNYSTNALPPNIVKDRIRSGSSLADVEPMKIDKNITFSSIGGLNKHIQALKEMVVFPLLYDKVFQRFNVDPPRGVLFYGPPGTGKTLVARALANECSKGDRRVAFFMRKGADCLSKWVGESERQLRILFDQAYKFRPSIIFFDEIDGLAPVRSSRQDQIHSSIVSTLLALMDGLDNRGEIVVIGATNRIDSLDPALRRPGRFDREFFFPLPSFEARKQILKIHTDSWTPKLNDHFISELAEKCVGYCGADLKSLCTEAAMLALRRRYPQIYMTNEALQIDVTSINISARDFFDAVNNIIPTAQRSVNTPARALPPRVQPLLLRQLNNAINTLKDIFPPCMTQTTSSLDATAATPGQTQLLAANSSVWDDLISDEDDNSPSIFVQPVSSKGKSLKKSIDENPGTSLKAVYLNFTRPATRYPSTFRPRLMLVGKSGQGQTTYIAPAIIHKMENLPIHVLDLPALYAVTAKTPEESCANVFLEARRKCPSIIYLPYINQWWDVMADTLKATLLTLIHDLNPSLPLLLLATSEQPYEDLDSVLQELFNHSSGEIIEMDDPNKEERRIYFRDLLLDQACKPPPQNRKAGSMLKFVAEHDKADSQLFHQTQSKRGQKRKSVSPLHSTCSSNKANDTICKMNTSENKPLDSITNLKEVPFSTHGMKLRPRVNVVKLNRNHSAKELKNVSDCIALNSKACDSLNNQNSLRTHGLNEYPQHIKNVEWNRHLKSARKGSFVSPRHERYVHRLLKLEKNLPKLGTQFFLPSSFSPTVHKDSQDQCCSSMNINEDCTLSCGSSQMLYKKSDSKNKIISDTDEINIDYFLPMNIKDLETFSVRNSNSTQATQSMDEIAFYNNESLVKQTRCYNLKINCLKKNAIKMLEVLPKAAPLKPSELTKQELEQLVEKEELTLMELRIFLRDVLNKLGSDKKFSIFAKPVNIENAPDYYEIIEHPMDLSTMMGKIDLHEYGTVKAFMNDIDLICSNALEYNPNRGPMDRIIRHRACALKDTAYAIIKTELDKDFEKTCVEIEESRKRRGHKSSTVPNFYFTKPQSQQPSGSKSQSVTPNYPENPKLARSIPKPEGERFSRRVRGLNTDPVPPLEAVEKVFKLSKSSTSSAIDENKDNQSNSKDSSNVSKKESTNLMNDPSSSLNQGTNSTNTVQSKGEQILENSELAKDSKSQPSSSSASKLKKKNKLNNIWCKPRRKRTKFMLKTEQSLQEAEMDVDEMEQCQDSKSNTEISHCHSSQQLSQQLRIETTENDTSEPKEEKFTTSGKSVRLKSPQISPTRVITRRSSMSPTNITLKSTEPSSSSQVQDKLTDLLKKDSTSYFCDQTKQSENKCNTELRKHGVTSETAEKPSAAKRLDLDSVVLDSGVGSSLDSNGDSRDSSDHSKTELSSKQAVITSVLDDNQNCNSELTSSVHALTDQSKKEVIIDKHRLASLLNVLVLNTEGFNVEQLEKIYSQFSHIIYNHRHNYNRDEMIVDLERKLEELVKVKISGPLSSFKK